MQKPFDDPTNQLVHDLLGCSLLQITRPWWAVKVDMHDGGTTWICEAHWKKDVYRGGERLTDWTKDIVANELNDAIRELWLFCPPGRVSPAGNTAMFPIIEKGTAFQLKVGHFFSNIASSGYKQTRAALIGRVTDKGSGACEAFIYDVQLEVLFAPWSTTMDTLHGIREESPWRPGVYEGLGTWIPGSIAPVPALAHDVLGIQIG